MRLNLLVLVFSALTTFYSIAGIQDVEIQSAYEDESGNLIVRFGYKSEYTHGVQNPAFFGTHLTFYGNDQTLYQLKRNSENGTSLRYHLSFFDPTQYQQSGHFYVGVDPMDSSATTEHNLLVCGQGTRNFFPISKQLKAHLQKEIRASRISLNPLPTDIRRPEYLFKSKTSDLYIYVDVSQFYYSYKSFRLFVGKPGDMKEREIKAVRRFRDGGTTYIELTDDTTLFTPSSFDQDKVPTWSDQTGKIELEKIKTKSFKLEKLGIKGVPGPAKDLKTPCELLK